MTEIVTDIDEAVAALLAAVEAHGFERAADLIDQAGDAIANAETEPPKHHETLIWALRMGIRTAGAVIAGRRTLTICSEPAGTSLQFEWEPGHPPSRLWAESVASSVSHATGVTLTADLSAIKGKTP